MRKKTFIKDGSPAMQFISRSSVDNISLNKEDHIKTIRRESKSKRLQLLIRPSLSIKLREIASSQGISLNELIHTVLDDYTKRREK